MLLWKGKDIIKILKNHFLKIEIFILVVSIAFFFFQIIVKLSTRVCIIQFDSMGGTQIISKRVDYGSKIKEPVIPKRNGYIFKGWYLGSDKFSFSESIVKSERLEAKWEKVP